MNKSHEKSISSKQQIFIAQRDGIIELYNYSIYQAEKKFRDNATILAIVKVIHLKLAITRLYELDFDEESIQQEINKLISLSGFSTGENYSPQRKDFQFNQDFSKDSKEKNLYPNYPTKFYIFFIVPIMLFVISCLFLAVFLITTHKFVEDKSVSTNTITPSLFPSPTKTSIATLIPTVSFTPTVTLGFTPTSTLAPTLQPTAALDDYQIIFAGRERDTTGDGKIDAQDVTQIFIIDSDGSNRRALTVGEQDYDPAISPHEEWVVFTSDTRSGDTPSLFLMSLTTNSIERITPANRRFSEPSWSPDGQTIYSTCDRRSICAINFSTKQITTVITGNDNAIYWNPVVSPNGQKLLFTARLEDTGGETLGIIDGCDLSSIYISDIDGNNIQKISEPDGGSGYGGAWSPDGSHIAYYSAFSNGGCTFNFRSYVKIYDLNNSSITAITDGTRWFRQPDWSPDGTYLVMVYAAADNNHDGEVNSNDLEELVIYNLTTKQIVTVENDSLEHFDPSWINK